MLPLFYHFVTIFGNMLSCVTIFGNMLPFCCHFWVGNFWWCHVHTLWKSFFHVAYVCSCGHVHELVKDDKLGLGTHQEWKFLHLFMPFCLHKDDITWLGVKNDDVIHLPGHACSHFVYTRMASQDTFVKF